jgi:hypothetical protein
MTVTPAVPPAPRQLAPARRPLLATAIAIALGTAPQVYAATEPGDTLEEVVVTANRREQNVLDVPYNISAVSGPALSNAGVTRCNHPGLGAPSEQQQQPDHHPRPQCQRSGELRLFTLGQRAHRVDLCG